MQSNVPQPATGPRGDGVRVIFKVAATVILVLLAVSALRIFGRKSLPAAAIATEQSPPEPAPEVKPWMPQSRPPRPSPVNASPSAVPTSASVDQRMEQAASNLWAAAGRTPEANKVIWPRVSPLQPGVEGMVAQFERRIFYDVADRYAGELRNDLAQIANATNLLKQYEVEFRALQAGLDADRLDYLRLAKATDERRQDEYAAAQRSQIEFQAFYMDRKQRYQRESAAISPQAQDPPEILERKLAELRRLRNNYEIDMNKLDAARLDLTKKIAAINQDLRGHSRNLDRAFEESAQDAISRVSGLSNRLHEQIRGINTSIRDYNAKLDLYGVPLAPGR